MFYKSQVNDKHNNNNNNKAITIKVMAQQIGTKLDKAANEAVKFGLWGLIGLAHRVGSVYNKLPSSETVSKTVESLIRQAQSSPISVTHADGDCEVIKPFNAPDVIAESGNGTELLEAGLYYPSKEQVPIYDIETGFGGSSISTDNKSTNTPIPFDLDKSINIYHDGEKWNYFDGPTFEATLDGDTLIDE